jgi:hypothetical protein
MKLIHFFSILILLLVITTSCSSKSMEGHIVSKRERSEGLQILVIKDLSEEELETITIGDLSVEQLNNSMYFFVGKNDFEKLEVGQKVKVWYEDSAMESLPPQTGAKKINVLE